MAQRGRDARGVDAVRISSLGVGIAVAADTPEEWMLSLSVNPGAGGVSFARKPFMEGP